jgi:hypothetical protein
MGGSLMTIGPNKIPDDIVYRMHYKEGKSFEQIKRELGFKSKGGIKMACDRFEKKLRVKSLQEAAFGETRKMLTEGDKTGDDVIPKGASLRIEAKIDVVNQLAEINQNLIGDIKALDEELKGKELLPSTKLGIRDLKRKIAAEIREQEKFAIEVAKAINLIDFKRVVLDVVNTVAPEAIPEIMERLKRLM